MAAATAETAVEVEATEAVAMAAATATEPEATVVEVEAMEAVVERARTKIKNMQHPAFPRGPPPQYYPGSSKLNFAVRMGSGDPC